MNSQLIKYITEQLAAGYSKEVISQALITQGWSPAVVETGFSAVNSVLAPVTQTLHSLSPATPVTTTITPATPAPTGGSILLKILLGLFALVGLGIASIAAFLVYAVFFNHNALTAPICASTHLIAERALSSSGNNNPEVAAGLLGSIDIMCPCQTNYVFGQIYSFISAVPKASKPEMVALGTQMGQNIIGVIQDVVREVIDVAVASKKQISFIDVAHGVCSRLDSAPLLTDQSSVGADGSANSTGGPFILTTPVGQPVTSTGYSVPIPGSDGITNQNLPPCSVVSAGAQCNGVSQFDSNSDANYKPIQVPLLSQNDPANGDMCQSACGPTAAAMVAKFWGVNVSTMDLITAAGTTEDGTSLKDVENGLVKVGLKNVSNDLGTIQIIWNSWNNGSPALHDITTAVSNGDPVLVGVKGDWYGSGHTLVVTGITNDNIYVNDPARKDPQVIPKADFMKSWKNNGYAYVIAKP